MSHSLKMVIGENVNILTFEYGVPRILSYAQELSETETKTPNVLFLSRSKLTNFSTYFNIYHVFFDEKSGLYIKGYKNSTPITINHKLVFDSAYEKMKQKHEKTFNEETYDYCIILEWFQECITRSLENCVQPVFSYDI